MNSRFRSGRLRPQADPVSVPSAGRERGETQKRRPGRASLCILLIQTFILLAGFVPCALAFPASGPALNSPAPEFALTDLNHKRLDLHAFRGKVVLLDFWATWCAPCQVEIPHFVAWQNQYGALGLKVIGISMDDDPGPVRNLYRRLRVNYPVAMGDAGLGQTYGGIYGLPVTFLIDRKGRIRAEYQGVTDLGKIQTRLLLLLNTR